MRIFYQSGTSLGKNSMWSEYEEMLRNHLNSIARSGTKVEIHGVETCTPNVDIYMYEELLHDRQIVDNLIRAEKEGYDAFSVGCALDPAFYALRQVANIPVSFMAESSMLLASLLAPNFTLLSYRKVQLLRVIELVKRYGLQDRFIECDSFQISLEELQNGFKRPDVVLKPAQKVAKEAAQKGVCMLVNTCGCLNMIFAKHHIREIEGIPLLESGGALIKMTEMLVDLKNMGMEGSRSGLYSRMPREHIESMRRLYGVSK